MRVGVSIHHGTTLVGGNTYLNNNNNNAATTKTQQEQEQEQREQQQQQQKQQQLFNTRAQEILFRIQDKLVGMERSANPTMTHLAPHRIRPRSVTEQVQMLIEEATASENLS